MLSNFFSSSSILKKFLVFNLIVFLVLGIFTFLYLDAIKPNLVKTRSAQHTRIINNTIELGRHLAEESSLQVETAMRYQEPSIDKGINSLVNKGSTSIQVIHLYNHYAISSTLTTKNKVKDVANQIDRDLIIDFVELFYNDPE